MSGVVSKQAWIIGSLWLSAAALAAGPPSARGVAAVASDQPLASACGTDVLARGGNAVDAAVATALCAGVVQPASSGLGGGGFAVVMIPGQGPVVLDFREVAPAAATRDLYRKADGSIDSLAAQRGGLSVAVPAESIGLATLLERWGSLRPKDVAAPAIALAKRGFVVSDHLASRLSDTWSDEIKASYAVDDGARLPDAGERIQRLEQARTLARWASTSGEDLHSGAGAEAIVAHVAAEGGILTAEDLASYLPKDRAPITIDLDGWTVITMPPPSSGGVAIAEVLGALRGVDLKAMGLNSSAYIHAVTEAMKFAYADRAHSLGDPDFVDVPVERLTSAERASEIRAAFDPNHTLPPERYGSLMAPPVDAGTQHISVVDDQGWAVALTTTVNTGFGSGLVLPGYGIVLNDQMDDFAIAPGTPNAYGLVGGEANAVAPGKRPLSSMSPTILLDPQGRVRLVVGASGGSTIISSVVEVIYAITTFGLSPADAVALPRFHHQWQPDELVVEPEMPADVIQALEARGHKVVVRRAFSSVQAISVDEQGVVSAGSDPRKGGAPSALPASARKPR
jgi:gamma-glutamyltranspeptidase/glutathione hydrolase